MLHLLLLAPLALPAPQQDAPTEAPPVPVAATSAPRAFLGVQISEAEGLGLRVDRVVEGSAAEAAGLVVGDVLAAFDGTDLSSPEQLQKLIAEAGVGAEVRLTVLREDAVENLSATLRGLEEAEPQEGVVIEELIEGPLLDELRQVQGDAPQIIELQGDLEELRGQLRELRAPVEIATLAPPADDRPFLGVYIGNEEGPGIQLEGTVEGSGAANAGVQQGDRLKSVGGSLVDDMDSLRAVLERYSVGDTVEVTVQRGDQSLDLLVELGAKPVEFEVPQGLQESLGDDWEFEGFDVQEFEGFEIDMDEFMELEEFEFDMEDLMEFEEYEVEFDDNWTEDGEVREFFFEVQDGQGFDVEELIDRINEGDRDLRTFEWNVDGLKELGDGNRYFLRTRPDGAGELFEFEWSDQDGQGAFKGQGRNFYEHDAHDLHDGFFEGRVENHFEHGHGAMPDWARELRHEMNEWRRDMERDMQSLRREFGSQGSWNMRTPATPRRVRLRGGSPGVWTGTFSPEGGGIQRLLEVEELHRHLPDGHGDGHAERHEIHVDGDGRRVERRFRGVRNGDGWDWTPMDGGSDAEIEVEVEIDRAVERALRQPRNVRRDAEEVEVLFELEVGRDAPRGHDRESDNVDSEIEALKRRLDELEAQRSELRERLKELKKRR